VGIFRSGLSKTRQSFFGRISQMLGNSEITDETWDDVEALLIQADMGVPTTQRVLSELRQSKKVSRAAIKSIKR
jgi:fused signal recognition particle receptor